MRDDLAIANFNRYSRKVGLCYRHVEEVRGLEAIECSGHSPHSIIGIGSIDTIHYTKCCTPLPEDSRCLCVIEMWMKDWNTHSHTWPHSQASPPCVHVYTNACEFKGQKSARGRVLERG